jgi:hypothetical protein
MSATNLLATVRRCVTRGPVPSGLPELFTARPRMYSAPAVARGHDQQRASRFPITVDFANRIARFLWLLLAAQPARSAHSNALKVWE